MPSATACVSRESSLLRFAFIFLLSLTLTSCIPAGQPVIGVADTSAWFSLPLDQSLGEGRANPEAISACASAECPYKIAVAVLSVQGAEADRLEKILQNPAALAGELQRREKAAELRRRHPGTKRIDVTVRVAPLSEGSGFTVSMARNDGTLTVSSAVIGWRTEQALKFVIAIGEDANTVLAAARKAAESYRNSIN